MSQLIMCRGISGSGKSTYVKKQVSQGNSFRVNRDDLRAMLHNGKWSRTNEQVVITAEKAIVESNLTRHQTVFIDDTNLLKSHEQLWRSVAESRGAEFSIKEFVPTIETCIARDEDRSIKGGHHVGGNVIYRQAIKSGLYNIPEEQPIAIFDIDGTLADGSKRQGLLKDKTDPKRWDRYFALAGTDWPIDPIIDKVYTHKLEGHAIFLVSGRAADKCWNATVRWLDHYGIEYEFLLMRGAKDTRPDTEIKKEILNEILIHHTKKQIVAVYDDRPKVVLQWRSLGLPIIPVYKGECLDINTFTTIHSANCPNVNLPIDGRCVDCGALEDF